MICRGSYGEITGARRAVTTSARTIRPPTAPSGFRLENRATALQGPASADDSMRISATAPPAIASLSAAISSSRGIASRAASSLVPDPGIEHAVRQIDHQVQAQDDRGDQQDDRLQHDEIPMDDAVDQQGPHAGHHEDRLDDDDAAKKARELITRNGQDGQERVLQRMSSDDSKLDEAFGTRRPQIVFP